MSHSPIALRRYLEISGQPAGSAFHTSQVSISFGEAIDGEALRAAWEVVATAHAALRSTFAPDGSITVSASPSLEWKTLDWQTAPPDDLGAEWQSLVNADASSPVASEPAPSCRFVLIRLPNGSGHALWTFHAALLDQDSISIVLREWLLAYDAIRTGSETLAIAEAPASSDADDESWASDFEGLVPPRPLIVMPLPDVPGSSPARQSVAHTFERPERAVFASAAKSLDVELRALFGAAWAFVVSRATSSDDALLLEPSRTSQAVGRVECGTVRRHRVAAQKTIGDLVRDFAANVFTPPADLSLMAQKLGLSSASIEPSTSFVYRELTLNDRLRLEMPRWMAADAQLMQQTPAAITLRATATDRPEVALDYDPARLSSAAAHTLFDLFCKTLVAFAENPSQTLSDFALPAPATEVEGSEPPASFRALVPQCLHELFADIAAESPDGTALEIDGEKTTFSQLNASANQLSRLLRKRGIATGTRVGISMDRSPKWIVALLATLKAGAVIVPAPPNAKEKICELQVWIVDSLAEGEERDLPVIQLQSDAAEISSEKSRGLQSESTPVAEALAFIEDGKTRTLTHEALAAALQSTSALLELSPIDRVLQFAPTGSFGAIEEAFATLLSGATLVLRTEPRWTTRTAFQEFVQDSAISALTVPTPFWSQWTHYLSELSITAPATLRIAATIGELPSPNAATAWPAIAGSSRLLHRTARGGLPGLASESSSGDPLGIACLGQPVPGTVARITDSQGRALPTGFSGHLETASRALPAEFSPLDREAFLSPTGSFYDRPRLQILIGASESGYSAEAIQLAAASHPEVFEAHVERHLIAARQEWCVWIVPRDSQRGEPHDFREWLTARLPAVPRRIRALPRLPLNEAGKVDSAALAEQLPDDASVTPTSKGSETEELLRKIISRTIGGRRIELDEIITDGRTKPQVAKLLLEAVIREEPRAELSDFTTGFSVRSLLRNVRSRKSGAGSKWTPLQPLRASGKMPALIFVHDFDGGAKLYGPLAAHLSADQPCYAITARGLSEDCHTTVEEMAQAYITALRVFDATGSYRLVGYGFGGTIAFEMARQLTAENTEVPLLALLASEPPVSHSARSFLSGGWKRALPALFGKKSPEETSSRRRAAESPVLRANQEAARRYTASPAPLQVHVFAPTQDFPAVRSVQNGWSACCDDVRIYQVPCRGTDMMTEPAVESLAEAISKLARAESLDGDLEED